jgi:hypothetical protein
MQNELRFKLGKLNIDKDLLEFLVIWGRDPDSFSIHYFKKITDYQFRKDQSNLLFNDIVKLLHFAGFDKGIIFLMMQMSIQDCLFFIAFL